MLPHQTGEYGTKPFLRWVRAQDRSHFGEGGHFGERTQHSPKCPRPRRHYPKKWRLKRQALNLASLWRVTACGDGSLSFDDCQSWPRDANARSPRHTRQAASTDYRIQRRDSPDPIRVVDTTPGWSLPHLLDWYNSTKSQQLFATNDICRKPHQTGECGTRPFLRWVWMQGRSSDTPGISKSASSSVGTSGVRG